MILYITITFLFYTERFCTDFLKSIKLYGDLFLSKFTKILIYNTLDYITLNLE
jgi:hypothetical protein